MWENLSADEINNVLLEYYEINRNPDDQKEDRAVQKLEDELSNNPEVMKFLQQYE